MYKYKYITIDPHLVQLDILTIHQLKVSELTSERFRLQINFGRFELPVPVDKLYDVI